MNVDVNSKISSYIQVRMSTVFIKSNQQTLNSLLSIYYLLGSVLLSHLLKLRILWGE